MMIGYASPEAAVGGPIALVESGDRITIDADAGAATLQVTEEELDARRSRWRRPRRRPLSGVLEKYARVVQSAFEGAVTHSGARRAAGGLRSKRRSQSG
jgi:dihydroxy-acid dehydratase